MTFFTFYRSEKCFFCEYGYYLQMKNPEEIFLGDSSPDFLQHLSYREIPEEAFVIGEWQGKPVFVHMDQLKEGATVTVRSILSNESEPLSMIASRASQLLSWYLNHRFCGRCGTPTKPKKEEPAMLCPSCEHMDFPRLSPAVMVRIRKDNKILLAKNSHYKGNHYSLIAGFVEAGETLEEALMREVQEEVGLEVKNIQYFHSQSWPMPHTLLVGFTADYAGGEITPDEEEILEAHWIDPGKEDNIPGKGSLAREMIDDFIENF